MKAFPTLTLAAALTFGAVATTSAQSLKPHDASVSLGDQTYSGVAVNLEAAPMEVRDALEKYADRHGIDMDVAGGLIFGRKKEFLVAENANVPEISEKAVTLRAKVADNGNGGTELTMFATYGDDVEITREGEYSKEFTGLVQFTDDFLADYVPEYHAERVGMAEKKVEGVEKDLADYRKDMSDNKEEITKLERENQELERKIADTESMLTEERSDLDRVRSTRTEAVEEVRDLSTNPSEPNN